MTLANVPTATVDRFRNGLDWAVFSLGVLSLSTAIGATVLTHMDIMPIKTTLTTEEIAVAPLPDVL